MTSLTSPVLDLVEDVLERDARCGAGRAPSCGAGRGGARPATWPPSRRSTTLKISPASGTPSRPRTSTGVDGPASVRVWPLSSSMARILPEYSPATTRSPTLQRAVLDEDGGDRAAGAVELGLDHVPLAGLVRVGLELEHLGLQRQHLEQLVDALLGLAPTRPRRWCRRPTLPGPGRARRACCGCGPGWRPACRSC